MNFATELKKLIDEWDAAMRAVSASHPEMTEEECAEVVGGILRGKLGV